MGLRNLVAVKEEQQSILQKQRSALQIALKQLAEQKSALDETYTIPQNYNIRPDLCSYELYGTSKYWWIFAKRNPDIIQDPINDFTAGTKIKIPSKNQLDNMK